MKAGLDNPLAMAFIAGRYAPADRQLDNMRRRIAERSVVRSRIVISVGEVDDGDRPGRPSQRGVL